mmetsp:Transcript_39805/g.62921  ORF Transcript_39805/g.62921 Transcript_39805/m.62921 type:complete len:112 (-) Transcript_39805:37-372(-)
MNAGIKREALKLETATTQATNSCFDMCIDFRNPNRRKSFSDYASDARDYVASLALFEESAGRSGTNDLQVDEIKCLERCAVKYVQTQRLLLQGLKKQPTHLKEAANDCLRM